MHEIAQSFAASIRGQARGERVPAADDLTFLTEVGNLNLGNLGGLFNFAEPEGDPKRARKIISKLEVVPKELVKRYERLRRGVKEGMEDWTRDMDGCAICREPFIEDIDDGTDIIVQEAQLENPAVDVSSGLPNTAAGLKFPPRTDDNPVSSNNPLNELSTSATETAASSLSLPSADNSSSSKKRRGSSDPQRILAFPCTGMHLFHAGCLAPWLARKTTCPTCRFDIDPGSLTLRLERFADRPTRQPPPPPIRMRSGREESRIPTDDVLRPVDVRPSVATPVLPSLPPVVPLQPYPRPRETQATQAAAGPSTSTRPPARERPAWQATSIWLPVSSDRDPSTAFPHSNTRLSRADRNGDSASATPTPARPMSDPLSGPTHSAPPPPLSRGQETAPPRRPEWKPPPNPGFKRWLTREERKKDGITVDGEEEDDIDIIEAGNREGQ